MNIQHLATDSLVPYDRNPRRNDQAVEAVARSIQEFGFNQPIVCDPDLVVVVGHTRLKAAQRLGLAQVPVLVVQDIPAERLQAYRIADNRLNELAEWDTDLLRQELEQIQAELGSTELTGFDLSDLEDTSDITQHTAYSRKIDTPIYTPRGEQPRVQDLTDQTHTLRLLEQIEQQDMDPEVRQFLRLAAQRHTVFDYGRIAEYYCHAPAEIQQLMEASALVIIDFEQAIEQGYVQLTQELERIYRSTHEATDE